MDVFIKIMQFIVSFSLLVFIHELGHFMASRLFKVRVDKFYIFFNPWFSLFKFKRGDTEYGIGWIPFGGYCKIAGMIDESIDTDQMAQPPKSDEFRSKPAWQRLLIMVGGVVMNIVLAISIFIFISYKWGDTYIANSDVKYGYAFCDLGHEIGFRDGDRILNVGGDTIEDIARIPLAIVTDQASYVTVLRDGQQMRIPITDAAMENLVNMGKKEFMKPLVPFEIKKVTDKSNAQAAGLQDGDKPVAVNSVAMRYLNQITTVLDDSKNKTINITVERDSAGVAVLRTLPVKVSDKGKIGVELVPFTEFIPLRTHQYTFWESFPAGLKLTGETLKGYGKTLRLIFSPKTEAYKSMGGVMTMVDIFPNVWDWHTFWGLTAFLSIMLAVMNILPIPALDGGHVVLLLYEMVTRRKPSEAFLVRAQLIGLVLVFGLILLANCNDIYRYIIK